MTGAIEPQRAILELPPRAGRFHVFDLAHSGIDPRPALAELRAGFIDGRTVVGVGEPLLKTLDASVVGLRTFPARSGAACSAPSTQGALFCFTAGDDPGEALHASRELRARLGAAFVAREVVDAFSYREGRDLSGYIDGTENPKGDAARAAALVAGSGPGLDGGSFVAVQRWLHDLDAFAKKSASERDALMGRHLESNEELADAPASAHVKRAAQESYAPPAFMLRRSMPYTTATESGLVFVAYGESLQRFERVLTRMLGLEDGIVDGLFSFTRPLSGGYYFCPPLQNGTLDLRALGL